MKGEAQVWEVVPMGVRPALIMPSCAQQGLRLFKEGQDSKTRKPGKERDGESQREIWPAREKACPVYQIADPKNGILEISDCKEKTWNIKTFGGWNLLYKYYSICVWPILVYISLNHLYYIYNIFYNVNVMKIVVILYCLRINDNKKVYRFSTDSNAF